MAPDVIWNATGELLDQKVHYNGREEVWGIPALASTNPSRI